MLFEKCRAKGYLGSTFFFLAQRSSDAIRRLISTLRLLCFRALIRWTGAARFPLGPPLHVDGGLGTILDTAEAPCTFVAEVRLAVLHLNVSHWTATSAGSAANAGI